MNMPKSWSERKHYMRSDEEYFDGSNDAEESDSGFTQHLGETRTGKIVTAVVLGLAVLSVGVTIGIAIARTLGVA